ncbi:ATP-binding cassette domain-containing protein [Kitasatospora sp. NPDC048722]|uniref:ATP-binding cassette domain-containing protein n=1 Tax=Kitasatospora sp. NPDC048722 TaxID=3155639 RepID=UPI003404E8CC
MARGSATGLLGPSGCGKTTLLRAIVRAEGRGGPDSGPRRRCGKPGPAAAGRIRHPVPLRVRGPECGREPALPRQAFHQGGDRERILRGLPVVEFPAMERPSAPSPPQAPAVALESAGSAVTTTRRFLPHDPREFYRGRRAAPAERLGSGADGGDWAIRGSRPSGDGGTARPKAGEGHEAKRRRCPRWQPEGRGSLRGPDTGNVSAHGDISRQ